MDDFRRARVCCLCVYAFSIFLLGRCGVSSAALAARSSTGATLILAVPVRIHGATTLNERAHARRASGPVRICCAWTRLCAHRLCAMALGRTDFAPRGGVRLHTSASMLGGAPGFQGGSPAGSGAKPQLGSGAGATRGCHTSERVPMRTRVWERRIHRRCPCVWSHGRAQRRRFFFRACGAQPVSRLSF